MPRHRLADLVSDVRLGTAAALSAVRARGGDPTTVTASGHSAGAHLACFLATASPDGAPPPPPPTRLLLLSGDYDPEPLHRSVLQAEIGLMEEDLAWAPLSTTPPEAQVTLIVGEAESPPFHERARALAVRWGATLIVSEGCDHMSIVHALGAPGTKVHTALARTVAGTAVGA